MTKKTSFFSKDITASLHWLNKLKSLVDKKLSYGDINSQLKKDNFRIMNHTLFQLLKDKGVIKKNKEIGYTWVSKNPDLPMVRAIYDELTKKKDWNATTAKVKSLLGEPKMLKFDQPKAVVKATGEWSITKSNDGKFVVSIKDAERTFMIQIPSDWPCTIDIFG